MVKKHIYNMFKKLEVKSRIALLHKAQEAGILRPQLFIRLSSHTFRFFFIPKWYCFYYQIPLSFISENKYKYALSWILRDQAELAGSLNTLYEMHMVVLSVNCLNADLDKSKI